MTCTDTPPTWPVVSCTGHRPKYLTAAEQLWSRRNLHRAAQWVRDNAGTQTGISGMAMGADLWWADAVVRAGLTLAAHIPCPDQTRGWPAESVAEHARLSALAAPGLSLVVSPVYSWQAMQDRNLGMLHASKAVVALWIPGTRGGTFNALCAAADLGLPGIHLDPRNRTIEFALPDPRSPRQ